MTTSKKEESYKFIIKTSEILSNKNLPKLIEKLENSELKEENNVSQMPEIVSNFLDGLSENFIIANKNGQWNATDIILDKNLPNRKLLYLGNGKNISLLTYNKGGIGKSTQILIMEYDKEKMLDFWCGSVLVDLNNKDQIIKYLKENMTKKWGLNTNILNY